MAYRPPYLDPDAIYIDGPHPATFDEADLLKECEISVGRTSGPGGQHRNKVATGVRIVHLPSGIEGRATERREQRVNRHKAIFRLRVKLALKLRCPTGRDNHEPSTLWVRRRQGEKLPINPENKDYPAILAEALNVILARKFDVAGAAGVLGITMSQLARILRHNRPALAMVNRGREKLGLHPLRS